MERLRELAYGLFSCTGRVTITGMLIAIGRQFVDWTSTYSLFWGDRVDMAELFEVSLHESLQQLDQNQMIVAHLDDTIIRKVGKKISGTSWRRDPLGPVFQSNLVWSQRFMQTSISLHGNHLNSQSKAIAVDFHHCPSVKKPGKNHSPEELVAYKEAQKQKNLNTQAIERITLLRNNIDKYGKSDKDVYLSVDGSYTNKTIFKGLPKKVTLIGRIRKDAKLSFEPESIKTKGRNIVYGENAPTPEQLRADDKMPYQTVKGWAAGKVHDFKIKVIKNLKWRIAGKEHSLQMVVIAPLGYRLKKTGKILYRQPAYLICTDNDLSAEKLLQAYLWRWEIEVNFREEKTVGGCGDAQVRNEVSAEKVPQFVVAMQAFLNLANHKSMKDNTNISLPKAKWEKSNSIQRNSTNNLLNLFKGYYWYEKLGKSFYDFIINEHKNTKSVKHLTDVISPVFYARK
jgi:hypothetical protein